jgi:hypothetical protein
VVNAAAKRRRARGLALLELLIASALGALLLGALTTLARDGLHVGRATRSSHETLYQARFALGQVVARAEAATPRPLSNPPAGTSGDWFGSTMYCLRSATAELIESTPSDTGCTTGTRVIGERISAFSVVQRSADPLDRPQALITLTATDVAGAQSVTLSAVARMGGGTR